MDMMAMEWAAASYNQSLIAQPEEGSRLNLEDRGLIP